MFTLSLKNNGKHKPRHPLGLCKCVPAGKGTGELGSWSFPRGPYTKTFQEELIPGARARLQGTSRKPVRGMECAAWGEAGATQFSS